MDGQTWTVSDSPKPPVPPPVQKTPKDSKTPKQQQPTPGWTVSDDSTHPESQSQTGLPNLDTPVGSGTPLSTLSADNPKSEGLYHMQDSEGHQYAVPFSRVEQAPGEWRNSFVTEAEAQRYEHDRKVAGSKYHKVRDKINELTEPTYDYENTPDSGAIGEGDLGTSEMLMNVLKRGVRGVVSFADLPPTIYGAVKDMASDDEKVADAGEERLWGLMPQEVVWNALKSYNEDRKKDPQKAAENVAGDLLSLYASGKLVEGTLGRLKMKGSPEEPPPPPGSPGKLKTMIARKLAGTGEGFTKREVAKKAAANKEIARANAEEYDPKYQEKVDEVNKENAKTQKEFEDAKTKRNNRIAEKIKRSKNLQKAMTRAQQHIQGVHDAAVDWFNRQYNELGRQTSGVREDLAPLTEAVEKEKLETLADPSTNVPIFEDIIKKSKGEAGEAKDASLPKDWKEMSFEDRKEWRDAQLDESGATFRYLLGKYRQIGRLLKSGSVKDPTVRQGLVNVRSVIEKMQERAAKAADANADERYAAEVSDWEKDVAERESEGLSREIAEKKAGPKPQPYTRKASQRNYSLTDAYRNFAQSYRDAGAWGTRIVNKDTSIEALKDLTKSDIPTETLSDIKRTLVGKEEAGGKATDATKWAEQWVGEDKGSQELNPAQKTTKVIDQLRKAQAEHDAVPEPGDAPTLKLKEKPKYNPRPERGYSETKLRNRREAQINRRIDFYSSPGFRLGARGLTTFGIADILAKVLGFPEGVALTAGGVSALSYLVPGQIIKLLSDPAMQERLLTITAKDRETLAKLPANQRVVVEQNIINMERVARKEGMVPKDAQVPLANFAKKDIVKAKAEVKVEEAKAAEEKKPEPSDDDDDPEGGAAPAGPSPGPEKPGGGGAAAVGEDETLPGMEGAVSEQQRAAAEHQAETQRQEAQASLSTPVNVDKQAGEIERNSPLFRDSGASGQGGLFGGESAPSVRQRAPLRRLDELHVDPKRFQYKLNTDAEGDTGSLDDTDWEQERAAPIVTWVDPEDGKEYVVNGHHRYGLAKRSGAEHIEISQLDPVKYPTASDARIAGALMNLSEGNGTAVDAAKFFRERGFTPADFKKAKLSLSKDVVRQGMQLAKLSDDLFDKVVAGKVDTMIGSAIGEATEDPIQQEAILKSIQKKEKAGGHVTPEQIRESVRLVSNAGTTTSKTLDLFGEHEETNSLWLEMGEVSEYVRNRLATERKAFRNVADEGTTELLKRTGTQANAADNAEEAAWLAAQREAYNKLSPTEGFINSELREAARRLAEKGANAREIKQEAYDEITKELAERTPRPPKAK